MPYRRPRRQLFEAREAVFAQMRAWRVIFKTSSKLDGCIWAQTFPWGELSTSDLSGVQWAPEDGKMLLVHSTQPSGDCDELVGAAVDVSRRCLCCAHSTGSSGVTNPHGNHAPSRIRATAAGAVYERRS